MKFNLKLFVLVGIFVGLRDVWGGEDVKNDDAAGFIVEKLTGQQKKEVNAAMVKRRVIKAVYQTEENRLVSIIQSNFKKNLSKVFVRVGNVGAVVEVHIESTGNDKNELSYDMQPNVKYTVYLIFKEECFEGTEGNLLLNSTASMFYDCTNLIYADFRFFNTTNVTDMTEMFRGCASLTELNLSSFNTQNVKNMSDMFSGCTALTELDLSKFDTQNVTDMSSMFYSCFSLTKLDLSNFDTKKVENMSWMFFACSALNELNLSKFNTKNVTSMFSMFDGCIALKKLDLGNFVFHNVCNMGDIFRRCNFENLCLPNTRKRCWCCGDRYVHLKGEVVVKLNQNNVEFEVVHDDPVSNEKVD